MKQGASIVAVLQGRQRTFSTEKAWAQCWAQALATAASQGAELAVLSGSPGWSGVCASAIQRAADLAARFGMWLVADLGPDSDDAGGTFPALHVLSSDGALVGAQRQIHLAPQGGQALLSDSEDLQVFGSPVGRLGLLCGADVAVPEVGRALTLMGAEVLIHVGALSDASEGAWLARLWREVQANQVFGLEVYSVGPGLVGRSGILAPVEMTPDGRGVVAQAPDCGSESVVVGEFDWEARERLLAAYPILDEMNLAMYRVQLLPLYRGETEM
jgi:predicted amidohydrolase